MELLRLVTYVNLGNEQWDQIVRFIELWATF